MISEPLQDYERERLESLDRAEAHKLLTSSERDELSSLRERAEARAKKEQGVRQMQALLASGELPGGIEEDPLTHGIRRVRATAPPSEWRNVFTGQSVRALGPGQRLQDLPEHNPELSLGRCLRAMAVGSWKHAQAEKRAMSESVTFEGGLLVPSGLTSRVIDLARAKSVVMNAGATTLLLDTDQTQVARIKTDPVFEMKSENAAFTPSEFVFDGINFVTSTIGTIIYASRELVADAINFEQMIEEQLAKAFAQELDRQLLAGSGTGELNGLNLLAGLSTDISGTVTWDDLLDALQQVREQNGEANGYIAPPSVATILSKQKTGDGVNSAAQYLAAPPEIAELNRWVSSQAATGEILLGDFRQVLVGLRQDVEVAVSAVAGETFERNQLAFRLVWRGDSNIQQENHLIKLTNIS